MPYDKRYVPKKPHKTSYVIQSTYDDRSPHPTYDDRHLTLKGYGCVICDIAPAYCPYFDGGNAEFDKKGKCILCINCDMNTEYTPVVTYKTIIALVNHLDEVHHLKLCDDVKNHISDRLHKT